MTTAVRSVDDRLTAVESKMVDLDHKMDLLAHKVDTLAAEVGNLRQDVRAVSQGTERLHRLIYHHILTPAQREAYDEDEASASS